MKPTAIVLPSWNPEEPRFIIENTTEHTDEDRAFKNNKCVFNQRLGFAYSVTEIVEVLNNDDAQFVSDLKALADNYNFKLEDVPEILEEYILIDNEVIEQRNIENTIKDAYENERTNIGKNVLKQLLEAIQ